jgi:uncharacterized Rmd1/YagE family protein
MADPDEPPERRPSPGVPAPRLHQFYAVAFVENFSLRELAPAFPGARVSAHELHLPLSADGDLFAYPFGAVVLHDLPAAERESALARLRAARPKLTPETVREEFQVREEPGARTRLVDGALVLGRFTAERAGVVSLVVAQSAAMEYYERIVEHLFARTNALVERLQARGDVSLRTRPLHRFIGEAIGIRTEVLSVLHLLDKPDATWEDPEMDRIYGDLKEEFDLTDRYQALEQKVRSVQEALELVLGVARDRRILFLELAIGLLILLELILALAGRL